MSIIGTIETIEKMFDDAAVEGYDEETPLALSTFAVDLKILLGEDKNVSFSNAGFKVGKQSFDWTDKVYDFLDELRLQK